MATVSDVVNQKLSHYTPAQIVVGTLAAAYVLHKSLELTHEGHLTKRVMGRVHALGRLVAAPIIRKKVESTAKTLTFTQKENEEIHETLPIEGQPMADVLALAARLRQTLDHDYSDGSVSGCVYHGGEAFSDFVNKVMELFQWTNPLHSDVFGAARKMEAEIASMTVGMYNGHARGACGAVTSGGTESIGMAVKVYRDWGRAKLGIEHPSIVLPVTAHPAFDKAAAYYGVRLIKVPVGRSGRVVPEELEQLIRADTVAIVGSSPTFPHGTIDPITALSEIAYRRGIGMHVDACLGGFVVPFLKEAGFPDPYVDFRNRGVTTISADTHKYGYAPKGTSVIMYGSKELREYQFFATAEWPGGIYCSPGASGSKAGNVIAGAWAAMIHYGKSGYVDACKRLVSTRVKITDAIAATPGLEVLGTPTASVFALSSEAVDVYLLSDKMKSRGWMLTPLQFPAGLQFSLTLLQTNPGVAERFISDIQEFTGEMLKANEERKARGEKVAVGAQGATMYGSQQRISDRTLCNMIMAHYLNGYYTTRHGSENIKQ